MSTSDLDPTAATAYKYDREDRDEVADWLPDGMRSMLDIGCGRGGFGRTARRHRPDAHLTGLEINAAAADEARAHFDDVIVGPFPDALAGLDRTFDVITLLDVVEHVADPWASLEALHAHLAPGGVLVSSIPNIRYLPVLYELLVRRDFRYREIGVLDRTHLRFFTQKGIRRLFADTGFRIDTMAGINSPLERMPALVRPVGHAVLRDTAYPQFVVVASPAR